MQKNKQNTQNQHRNTDTNKNKKRNNSKHKYTETNGQHSVNRTTTKIEKYRKTRKEHIFTKNYKETET